jgi:hypothetical protein
MIFDCSSVTVDVNLEINCQIHNVTYIGLFLHTCINLKSCIWSYISQLIYMYYGNTLKLALSGPSLQHYRPPGKTVH